MPIGVYKRTEAHKKAMSESHKGKTTHMLGKHHTEETKNKIRMKLWKLKEKECPICNVTFHPKDSLDKFCSNKCFYIRLKDRKGDKNPAFRNGLRKDGKTTITKEHAKACKQYKKVFIEKNDYVFCEVCRVNSAMRFEVHHIYYASRFPRHKNLHDTRNLILLCIGCHNKFHAGKYKAEFDAIEEERGLKQLFS